MLNNFLCWMGLHRWKIIQKFLPSIKAIIVTDYISYLECAHCKKVKQRTHFVWNGHDMVDKNKPE